VNRKAGHCKRDSLTSQFIRNLIWTRGRENLACTVLILGLQKSSYIHKGLWTKPDSRVTGKLRLENACGPVDYFA